MANIGYRVLVEGLIGEIITLIPLSKGFLEKAASAFCVAVIIVGVAIEHGADNRISDLVSQRQAVADVDVANAQRDAKQAGQRAMEASLELAKFKAPRVLKMSQQNKISAKIRSFSGTEFDTAMTLGDPEVTDLADMIETALANGGWKQINWSGGGLVIRRDGKPTSGEATIAGITVGVTTLASVDVRATPERIAGLEHITEILAAALFWCIFLE